MTKIYTVGILGGGVSGSVAALQLAKHGIDNILFEKKESLVNGPPFCHLHAGGNLYPDISDEQCKILMKQSIEMARLFPQSIDERPTFISIPKSENKYEVHQITDRLEILVDYYKQLIKEDPRNEILGTPEDYYEVYDENRIASLKKLKTVERPSTPDEWMTNALKLVDDEKLKKPIILVQEYGWNLFRLGAQAQIALQKSSKCDLNLNTAVIRVTDVRDNKTVEHNWEIYTNTSVYKVKYLVNSCGFKTGEIDDSLQLKSKRLIEFKAAYVSKWQPIEGLIPELIFHGERGTPHGMAQLTPYCDDYYQIHGMTENITLFKNGLVTAKENNAQPKFTNDIDKKLDKGWNENETNNRTKNAIDFVAQFVPSFSSSEVGGPPLFGAQQIPGDDPTLRVGEVSFPSAFYARSEIVKASSALTVANQIMNKMMDEDVIKNFKKINPKFEQNSLLDAVPKSEIDILASEFTNQRGYPNALSKLVIEKI